MDAQISRHLEGSELPLRRHEKGRLGLGLVLNGLFCRYGQGLAVMPDLLPNGHGLTSVKVDIGPRQNKVKFPWPQEYHVSPDFFGWVRI